MNLQLDDGFQFGLGVFETICIYHHQPVFLDWHLERINNSLTCLGIHQHVTLQEVENWLHTHHTEEPSDLAALKIMVSEKNKLFAFRSNPYTKDVLSKGFRLDYSPILRNETSPLVCHKSMNYGDNIIEKRRTHTLDIDEVVFLNTKGELTEGSTTNLFFVKSGIIYTPALLCGLLPGVLRRYVMTRFQVHEIILHPEDIPLMDECFVTNSLIGIMPVSSLGDHIFQMQNTAMNCMACYQEEVLDSICSKRKHSSR